MAALTERQLCPEIGSSRRTPTMPAIWLFGSSLLGFVDMARRNKAA
jgi:hypothetical protein